MAIAAAGAVASVAALLLAGVGLGTLPFWYAAAGVGMFVVTMVGMFTLQMILQMKVGQREMWKILREGCPKPTRWALYGLSSVGIAIWFILGFQKYQPPSGGISSLMAGAFGLFVFPAGLVSFYSYSRMRAQLRRRCSNGHPLPLAARFCPECGENVRSGD